MQVLMQVRLFLLLAVLCCMCYVCTGQSSFSAGAAKVDGTLPIGVPLAGYNHGDRRVKHWPIPNNTKWTTFLNPSQGIINPTWIRALVVEDGNERVCFVTHDLMSADSSLAFLAHLMAKSQGFTVPFHKVTFSGSHTHSGPGTFVPQFPIQVTPTMDLFVPATQRRLAAHIAEAMVEAERNMRPASVGVNFGLLTNVTYNRRANISPYLNSTSIDPNVGVLAVNDASDGSAIATLWNFAVHGTCYGPSNMNFSSDIMGYGCQQIEEQGGGIALFVNGDAGDISPTGAACANAPQFTGGLNMANTVMATRATAEFNTVGSIAASSFVYDIGLTETNWTLARDANCTTGGPFNICTICDILGCDLNIEAGWSWLEERPRFTAFRFTINNKNSLFVSIPGEALLQLGDQIRNDSALMGFDNTFLVGYTNNYLLYFATPREYVLGGYEANLTVFGYYTAEKIRGACDKAALGVAPALSAANATHENGRTQREEKKGRLLLEKMTEIRLSLP